MKALCLALALPLALPAGAFQVPPAGAGPAVLEAKSLPKVPGPFADRYQQTYRQRIPTPADPIRRQARHTLSIPALALPEVPAGGSLTVKAVVDDPAGWKAYRVEVPAKSTVKVRLHADHEGWFLVHATDHWGGLVEGMLQNLIPTGNPEASFTNGKTQPAMAYFVVDTSEDRLQGEAYTLTVTRP